MRRADGRVERQPFPNNIIPANRISPIAREYLKYYPLPNQAGNATGLNNYISTNPRGDDFYSMNYRVDHVLTDKQRFFVRYSRNNREENRGNWTGEVNGDPADRQLPLPHQRRVQRRPRLDDVARHRCSTCARAIRASRSRASASTRGCSIPPASASRPAATQYFGDNQYFPRFEFDDGSFSDLGDTFAGGTNCEHLLVPADLDADSRSAQLPVGRRFPRLSRRAASRACTRPAAMTTSATAPTFHQTAGQLVRGGDRAGSGGLAARTAERRAHRSQHDPLQPGASTAACSSRTTGRSTTS